MLEILPISALYCFFAYWKPPAGSASTPLFSLRSHKDRGPKIKVLQSTKSSCKVSLSLVWFTSGFLYLARVLNAMHTRASPFGVRSKQRTLIDPKTDCLDLARTNTHGSKFWRCCCRYFDYFNLTAITAHHHEAHQHIIMRPTSSGAKFTLLSPGTSPRASMSSGAKGLQPLSAAGDP